MQIKITLAFLFPPVLYLVLRQTATKSDPLKVGKTNSYTPSYIYSQLLFNTFHFGGEGKKVQLEDTIHSLQIKVSNEGNQFFYLHSDALILFGCSKCLVKVTVAFLIFVALSVSSCVVPTRKAVWKDRLTKKLINFLNTLVRTVSER